MYKLLLTFSILVFSSATLAHHPLGGLPMETFAHGLLSGIGHPLLGFDHLFFIAAVGVAAVLTHRRLLAPFAYIATMLIGCMVTALWTTAAVSELMIALSLLILGAMLLSGRNFATFTVCIAFAAFGLFHGAAFGDTLAAQEASYGTQVLMGYLFGLGITQYIVAMISGTIIGRLSEFSGANPIQPRLAGAMVAGVGMFLVLEYLEGPLLKLITS
ncbi:MAG: HupE/UreJ family protein [Gammaproteobacteria bacterium]